MQPIRVLITDDDADAWDLLCAVCDLDGFVVEVADDGLDALRMLLQTREPYIALLDIALPIMNGLEICVRLRAAGAPVPRHQVVLMSTGVFPEGGPPPPARYMLRKPWEPARLRAILTDLAQTIRGERSAVAVGQSPGRESEPR